MSNEKNERDQTCSLNGDFRSGILRGTEQGNID